VNVIDPNHPSRAEHEFDGQQNEIFKGLGGSMTVVGVFIAVLGVLNALYSLKAGSTLGVILGLGVGASMLLTGVWLLSAATRFRDIVNTQGNDLAHLMAAIARLTNVYVLQAWMISISVVITLIRVGYAIYEATQHKAYLY